MQKLYFVRHALSTYGQQGRWAGSSNPPLADEGRQQAKEAGELAKTLGIDKIISSPLERTAETAQIIAKAIGYPLNEITYNSLFVERDFGQLEGTVWQADLDLDGFADVETNNELLERARLCKDLLDSLPYDTVLVVSHGSIGRRIRYMYNADFPPHVGQGFINAEIVRLFG